MNRGSVGSMTDENGREAGFNEAPIHESGKYWEPTWKEHGGLVLQ